MHRAPEAHQRVRMEAWPVGRLARGRRRDSEEMNTGINLDNGWPSHGRPAEKQGAQDRFIASSPLSFRPMI